MCLADGAGDAGDSRDGRCDSAAGLTVQASGCDGRYTLVLTGELDLRSRPLLDEALARFRRESALTLTLDLSGLAFMDSTGLHGVLQAKAICAETACELIVVRSSEQVQRLFELSGVLEELRFADGAAG